MTAINNVAELASTVESLLARIISSIEDFVSHGSGWVFSKSVELFIKTAPMTVVGRGYKKLPKWIESKKCCVNVKNEDEKCFIWSVFWNQSTQWILRATLTWFLTMFPSNQN